MSNQISADFHSNDISPEEKERLYARRRYKENPAQYREYVRKYAYANRRARYANLLVHLAVRDGKLAKQPCEICGNTKVDAHHDDYEHPLNVRWLCRKHHRMLHKPAKKIVEKCVDKCGTA